MTTNSPPRKLRTWSSFGEIRRRPSEYELASQTTNYTLRSGRLAPLEQNSSSPANLWLRAYREGSPFKADDWESFRDPDALTYRGYVRTQHTEEVRIGALLERYAQAGHDPALADEWAHVLRLAFTPTRYVAHGLQMTQSYIAAMAPSGYITNVASLAAADQLRRNTLVSYRTRELQLAHPGAGFATGERGIWESHPAWQPTRATVERALTAYDWGEAFVSVNLVVAPTLDGLLIGALGDAARAAHDELTWLLTESLRADSARRSRWSVSLVRLATGQRPDNRAILDEWIAKWAPRADAAVDALSAVLPDAARAAVTAKQERHSVLAEAGLGLPAAVEG